MLNGSSENRIWERDPDLWFYLAQDKESVFAVVKVIVKHGVPENEPNL
jgi:hypothetical protein